MKAKVMGKFVIYITIFIVISVIIAMLDGTHTAKESKFRREIIANMSPLITAVSGKLDGLDVRREINKQYSECKYVIEKYNAHIYYQEDRFLVYQSTTGYAYYNKSPSVFKITADREKTPADILKLMTNENELIIH